MGAPRTTCLVAVWDEGIYRVRCSMGTNGKCFKHGPHKPHPDDGKPCEPNPQDGYCHTHGVYMEPVTTLEATSQPAQGANGAAGVAGGHSEPQIVSERHVLDDAQVARMAEMQRHINEMAARLAAIAATPGDEREARP